jgi:hypothetical protein
MILHRYPLAFLTLGLYFLADDPRGEIAEGLRLDREVAVRIEAESSLIEQYVGDESREADGSFEYELSIDARVLDEVLTVTDGRATAFLRSFAAADRSEVNRFGDEQGESEAESELTGHTIRFELDDDEWERSAEDSDLDDELFEALEPDLDLSFLLPDELPEVGESWEIDATHVEQLVDPTGDLAFESDAPESFQEALDAAAEDMWDDFDGDVTVTFSGIEEVDGASCAIFTLTVEGDGRGRFSAELEDDDSEMDGERIVESGLELELEGRLCWDSRGGHARAYELAGTIVLTRVQGVELTAPNGEEIGLGQRMELEGELSVSVTTRAAD